MSSKLLTNITMQTLSRELTQRRETADSKVPGLVARAEQSGRPSYHVRKMIRGRRYKAAIGAFPQMDLAEARRIALTWLEAWEAGYDAPQDDEAPIAAPSPPVKGKTVRQALYDWQAAKDSPRDPKRWKAKHARGVERSVKVEILPKLGDRVLRETTREEWTALVIAKKATAPATASLLYRHISSFLNYADAAGWSPALLARKGQHKLAPPPTARARTLSDAELVAIWRACDSLSVRQRAFVRLLMLTAARVGEVAGITPIEIAATRWTLPKDRAKNMHPHVMPLCPLAIRELRAVGNDLGRFSAFSKLKRRLDEKCGVTDWVFHDFRRSVRSFFSANDVLSEHAEAALNHMRAGLRQVYDQHDYAPQVIRALKLWQDHVAHIVGGGGGANVVDLRARRLRSSPFLLPGASPAGQ
jgi:integrase